MSYSVALMKQLDAVDPQLRTVLWTILEEIEQHRESSVTKNEFAELKNIVADQVKIQAETREIVKQLAEAQQRTEIQVQRTEMQVQRTEIQVQRAEEQIAILTGQIQGVRGQVGGLAKSVAYALENEAYRKLPGYLRNKYDIEVRERLIRTTIGGREINLFAHAERAGQAILLVGESVLRLNDVSKLKQVYEQIEAVRTEFDCEVVPLVITHFATPEILARAEAEKVLVVQSYEWDFD